MWNFASVTYCFVRICTVQDPENERKKAICNNKI